MQTLRVRLLGDLQIDGCEPSRLGRRQLRTLFKILALHHDRPVSSDRLIEYLWGEKAPGGATDQISVLISRLRNVVGPDRIRRTDAGYSLNVDWLDLDALAEYATQAEVRLAQGAVSAGRAAAVAGLALVRGPLLADEADAWWAVAERSASEVLVGRLQRAAAEACGRAGDWPEVVSLAKKMLDADPYDETALRHLMEALRRTGRAASALAAYAAVRGQLADDLGIDPSPDTEALHTSILLGEAPGIVPPSGPGEAMPDLPGRASALEELDALLHRASGGEVMAVSIEGEAGIGKTRLLDVWCSRAESKGTRVVRVACDEFGQALPLQPLLDAISDLVHRHGEGDPTSALGPDTHLLGPLIGYPVAPAESVPLAALTDPAAGQILLFGALTGVFRRWAMDETLALVLDDVHMADQSTLRWLAQATRRLAHNHLLFVAARRPEEGSRIPGFASIVLQPLDRTAVAHVVGEARATMLHQRSGGNPLFLTELAASDAADDLPESIRDSVEQRCERAGEAGATLRTAAVIGPEIDLDLLVAVTEINPSRLLDHLEVGVERRFLVEDGQGFSFAHVLVRDALAATVRAARAALIHRSVARALRSRGDADPLDVARHARLGGDVNDAAEMLVAAARMAVSRFDQEEAIRLLNDAIAMNDTAEARVERARLHSMAARPREADEDIAAALSLGAGPEALEVAAWSAHFARRLPDALRLADEGAAQAVTDEVRASCLALGGWVSLASGDLSGAEHRLEAALGAAADAGGGMAESWMAWLRVNQGRADESLPLATQERGTGLAMYRFPNAYGLMATVMGLAMLGRAADALAATATLEAEVFRMGATRWIPRPLNLRGWIIRNLGEGSQADELNQAAMEAAHTVDQAEPRANALLDLAAGRLLVDDLAAMAQLLDEASALLNVDHAFRWRHEMRGRLLKARLSLAAGDHEDALQAARILASDASARGTPRYGVQAALVAAVAAHRSGLEVDRDEVDKLLVALDSVAGLESWWITGEVARVFGVARWDALARRRVADLRAQAGSYAASLERLAARRLA